MKASDLSGFAKAFQESNQQFHEAEWEQFIEAIRTKMNTHHKEVQKILSSPKTGGFILLYWPPKAKRSDGGLSEVDSLSAYYHGPSKEMAEAMREGAFFAMMKRFAKLGVLRFRV